MSTAPFDIASIDLDGFLSELRALRAAIDASLGPEDLAHLARIERWGRAATAVGLATAWIAPNPVSAIALALGRSTRWLLMHHVGHRGYDRVPGVAPRHTSRVFARGWRRWIDWPDWMLPEAWIYEHNVLHHQNTGEVRDPDLIERNVEPLRLARLPSALRGAALATLAFTWKLSYYAPNTLREWTARHDRKRTAGDPPVPWWTFVTRCAGPYAAVQFVALPLAYAPLGPWAVASAFCNSVLAEAIHNAHTFFVVGPNHTGDDLYRFDDRPESKGEFYLRQVIGSANYRTGGDLNDWLHLWLNYQIEHHLFPDVPMRQYPLVQPRVRALCARYGVPYVQAPVVTRFRKMAAVFTGAAVMRRAPPRRRRQRPDATSVEQSAG